MKYFAKIIGTIIGISLILFPEAAATVAGIVMLIFLWSHKE